MRSRGGGALRALNSWRVPLTRRCAPTSPRKRGEVTRGHHLASQIESAVWVPAFAGTTVRTAGYHGAQSSPHRLRRDQRLLEMGAHAARGLREIAGGDRFDDGKMLAAPLLDTAAVDIAAELQKPSQAILHLDRLRKERVAARLGEHLMEGGVGVE